MSAVFVWAQTAQASATSDVWSANSDRLGKSIPQEQVFVHMDNTCYFLGDTIYYKAYVRRSDTGKPTDISEVLYVELLNQDGFLVERQVLRLRQGQAHGSFCLEDTLYAGYHELRAYTRWQLNFGRKEHPHSASMNEWFLKKEYAKEFFVDYDKLYSRVFPVYDKPQEPGEYYRDMTVRPLRRDYAKEEGSRKPVVSLFPEGGNLINNACQRVAFEVKDGEGRHVSGILYVLSEKGDTLCSAPTENRGRGCFELRVGQEKYKAFFVEENGRRTKVVLPDILDTGAAMKVEQDAACIKADIDIQGVDENSVWLLITSCGRPRMQIPFDGKILTVSKDSLPAGVAQLTLVAEDRVLADRLVFVHHQDIMQKASLQFSGVKQEYAPLEKVSLKVQGKANASVSVSVRDNVSSDLIYDNGNIMTEMLLSSHIKGFVENPGYYFEADDSLHKRHLDLLLMVQGWRRFGVKQPEIVEPYEKSQIIIGEVNKYTSLDQEDMFYLSPPPPDCEPIGMRRGYGGPIPLYAIGGGSAYAPFEYVEINPDFDPEFPSPPHMPLWYLLEFDPKHPKNPDPASRPLMTYDCESLRSPDRKTSLHAEFVQPGFSPVIGNLSVKDDGRFNIQAPHFGGYCIMHLAAAKPEHAEKAENGKDVKKGETMSYQWLLPDAKEYADYSIRLHRCFPRFVKPYDYYQQQFMAEEDGQSQNQVKTGDVTTLQEVKVKAGRRIYRKLNLDKPALVLDAYDAFNQIVDAGLTCAYYAGSMSFSNTVSRMLFGDMGLDRTYAMERRWNGRTLSVNSIQVPDEQFMYNKLENLDKVYVYTDYSPRMEGDSKFEGADQPSVTIDLHRYPDGSKRATYRDRFIVLDGYSAPAGFYHPDYSKHRLPEGQKDYRRTLYWNPELLLDGNGEADVSFYNNSRHSNLSIEANGQAADGTLLTGKISQGGR